MALYKTWFAKQSWKDVLFLHWPISPEVLHPLIKSPLELDIFKDQAWISVVLFQARDSRMRGMPKALAYPPFLQLNLRTYVLFNNKPGIYFFSVDTNHSLVVQGAKLFSIPFQKSKMAQKKINNRFIFTSNRVQSYYRQANFTVTYQPKSTSFTPKTGTLNHWLIERYSFWTIKNKRIYEGSLTHKPWQLQPAFADVSLSKLFPFPYEFLLSQDPLTYYTSFMQAYLYPFRVQGFLG